MKRFVTTIEAVVAGRVFKPGDTIATLDSDVDLGTLAALAGSGTIVAGPEPKAPKAEPTPKPKPAAKSASTKQTKRGE